MAAKGQEQGFEEKLAAEEVAGRAARLDDAPPIGMNADGKLNLIAPGEVDTWEPEIVTGDDEDDGYADLEGDDGETPETPEED